MPGQAGRTHEPVPGLEVLTSHAAGSAPGQEVTVTSTAYCAIAHVAIGVGCSVDRTEQHKAVYSVITAVRK